MFLIPHLVHQLALMMILKTWLSPTLVLVAKSPPPSSSLFHEACKVRERGGVWSNTL